MASSKLEMLLINEIEKRELKNRIMSNLEKQINTVLELRAKRRVSKRIPSNMEKQLQAVLENRKKKHASALKQLCDK
jgi:hypothetical protein